MDAKDSIKEFSKAWHEQADRMTLLYKDMLLWRTGLISVMYELGITELEISDSTEECMHKIVKDTPIFLDIVTSASGKNVIRLNLDDSLLPGLDVFKDFFEDEDEG